MSPTDTVSSTEKLYGEFKNCGSLSLTSRTIIKNDKIYQINILLNKIDDSRNITMRLPVISRCWGTMFLKLSS